MEASSSSQREEAAASALERPKQTEELLQRLLLVPVQQSVDSALTFLPCVMGDAMLLRRIACKGDSPCSQPVRAASSSIT